MSSVEHGLLSLPQHLISVSLTGVGSGTGRNLTLVNECRLWIRTCHHFYSTRYQFC